MKRFVVVIMVSLALFLLLALLNVSLGSVSVWRADA
jgi:hypothetical protein